MCQHTQHQSQCVWQRRKAKHIFSNRVQKYIEIGSALCPFKHCMWIVGPPNSHGMLVNMPKMGSTFITMNRCGCSHVCHFKFWKKVTVKCEAHFFVLGCYILQQMVLVTFRSATNYHYFLCCWLWRDELWGRLSSWFSWTENRSC